MKFFYYLFPSIIFILACMACTNFGKETAQLHKKPIIYFPSDTIKFGVLHKDSVLEKYLPFVNVGTDTLKLLRIEGQCGCTEGYFSNKHVAPTAKAAVCIQYKPNAVDSGVVIKKILIETNTDTIFRTLYLKGIVKR